MPSYVITGASRGLGIVLQPSKYEFIRQLSSNPGNVVVGLVRNRTQTEKKAAEDGLKNVTILQADITDLPALQRAAEKVKALTGGSLDYLINNAALVSDASGYKSLDEFESDPSALEKDLLESFNVNVVGVVKTINTFMPLIQQSSVKKVVTISTGMADVDLVNDFEIDNAAPYSISKIATNMVVAKYNARYKKDGILFLAISPGLVDTGGAPPPPDHPMIAKFAAYAPHFKGPITAEESVKAVMGVVERASVEGGDGGAFISHLGNKQWL